MVEMLVEIPAGTNNKLEYNKERSTIEQDSIDGEARVIAYLAYPGNYGMLPNTLLAKSEGGDGDPLDVIAIGPSVAVGAKLKCRLIGVLKMLDGGEQDDKLIAIGANSNIQDVNSIDELNELYPGLSQILKIWFKNYKGKDRIEVIGYGNAEEAWSIYTKALSPKD